MTGRMTTWSQEDDNKLRALAMSGLSATQIAEQIPRSMNSIRNRAAKLGIAIARDGWETSRLAVSLPRLTDPSQL